jgi:hypothetical protein
MNLTSSPLPSTALGQSALFDVDSFQGDHQIIDSNSKFLPFLLRKRLLGQSHSSKRITQEMVINADVIVDHDIQLNWLHQDFPQDVWQTLPVQSHRLAPPADDRRRTIQLALGQLNAIHPDSANLLQHYVSNIVWLELDPEHRKENDQITSSSFPVLPWTIFVSDKARHHIPPNTVADEPSYRFFAENIFHEAVHQQVNALLLSTDIFVPDYDSSTCPKIEIAWRFNQGVERNQYWELDRTFHAAAVYIELCGFRLRELLSEKEVRQKSYEYEYFSAALKEATHALTYLCDELEHYQEYFTPKGIKVLDSLLHNRHIAISRCATEILL